MQLIDEQNDLSFTLLDFFQNGFQTFLKLATVLGTCNQGTHIQGEQLLIFQSFRHITADNTLCQTLNNGRFTNTRFTDQNRVILRLTGQDTNHVTDLTIPADHRIQLLVSGPLYQVIAIFLQRIISCFRIITDHSLITSDRGKCLQKALSGDTILLKQFFQRLVRLF